MELGVSSVTITRMWNDCSLHSDVKSAQLPGNLPVASDSARLDLLFNALAVVFVAMCGAFLAALAIYCWAPLKDPLDVVGVPLLTGYSESREQWSWFAFSVLTPVLVIALSSVVTKVSRDLLYLLGGVGLLIPLCLPAWSQCPQSLPAATLAGIAGFLAGATCGRKLKWSAAWANCVVVCGVAVWAAGFPELPMILVSHWIGFLIVAIGGLSFCWLHKRLPTGWVGPHCRWPHLAAALVVVCGTAASSPKKLLLGLAGAAVFGLGMSARPAGRLLSAFAGCAWIASVAVLAGVLYSTPFWATAGTIAPMLAVAGGAAGAAVLTMVLPAQLAVRASAMVADSRLPVRLTWSAVTTMVLMGMFKPWLALVTVTAAIATWFGETRRRLNCPMFFAVSVVLLFLVLPSGVQSGLDSFHDGHILSAVWEFESGKALYSEVFPLWSFNFFVTWLSSRIFGLSVSGYFFGTSVLCFLPVVGAYLLAFAWTRSLAWSFATALAVACCPELIGRFGVHLLFAAVAVGALRSASRINLIWFIAAGPPAALAGYDVFVSFVGAAVVAVLFGGPPGQGRRRGVMPTLKNLGWAMVMALAMVIPFTVLVSLWQGPRAATAFWSLLLDNARHHSAFAGLPLPWSKEWLRPLMFSALAVVGLWGGVGTALWPRASGSRQRAWMFLLVQFTLMATRGLGRSDRPHLTALVYPSLVLASIALFECLRFLKRSGVRNLFTDPRAVAFSVAAAACWLTPHGGVTLLHFLRYAGKVRSDVRHEPSADPIVLERVGKDEYLWEIENGLMSYANRRHNPTRQPLTYYICSPHEQRVTVAALRERPPKLIAWHYVSGSDKIPNPLRYYVISQYLYGHYRPAAAGRFLEPADPSWEGENDLPLGFLGKLPLGQLPVRWGQDRIPRLGARLLAQERLEVPASHHSRLASWQIEVGISPREFNYLELEFACTNGSETTKGRSNVLLLLAPNGEIFEDQSEVSFNVIADGVVHRYLIPIGCSPGWSWRRTMDRMALVAPDDALISRPQVECWRIDDL